MLNFQLLPVCNFNSWQVIDCVMPGGHKGNIGEDFMKSLMQKIIWGYTLYWVLRAWTRNVGASTWQSCSVIIEVFRLLLHFRLPWSTGSVLVGIVHWGSSSYVYDHAVLSAKLLLLLSVIMRCLTEVHGYAVDVTFVLLFLFFFFSSFKKYVENNNEKVII